MQKILLTFTLFQVFAVSFGQQEDQSIIFGQQDDKIDLKIVNRRPKLCATKQGEICVFPFTYKGVRYEKCTYTQSSRPWCATQTNNKGEVITNKWGDCSLTGDSSCEAEQRSQPLGNPRCVTVGGPSSNKQCIFPFTHGGVVYNECTTTGLGQSWCSVAVYANGTHISGQGLYGLCPSTCIGGQADTCTPGRTWQEGCNTCTCSLVKSKQCTTKKCNAAGAGAGNRCSVIEGPAQGQECVFPFVWGGRRFTSCTQWTYGGQHQGKLWCSTRTDSQGRHINGQGNFGFCSRSCDSSSSNVNNVDLGIFERRPGFDDDETAIVFTDNEDDAIVKMPPS